MHPHFHSFLGGLLIGIASLIMLIFNGKILGISGILGGSFQKSIDKKSWRYFFLAGLLCGGLVLHAYAPSVFAFTLSRSPYALVVAGLLVGYGTRLGSGCTSGHGICGISRLSARSLMAVLTFIALGATTVFVINHLLGARI